MARLAGVDLPRNKRMEIALTYVYGIGRSAALKVCADAQVDPGRKSDDISDDEVTRLRRVQIGGLVLGALPPGAWRVVGEPELARAFPAYPGE